MKAKVMMYLIVVAAIMFATTQPPQVGYSQRQRATSIKPDAEVQQLLKKLDEKNAELKEVIRKQKPKVVYRYVTRKPEHITVYTRINGEVTEHHIKQNGGFYVLDLEPKKETVTQTYYVDTCIQEQKKSLWKRLFSQR